MAHPPLTILQILALRKFKDHGEKFPAFHGWMNLRTLRLRMKMTTVRALVARELVEVTVGAYRITEAGRQALKNAEVIVERV